MAKGIEDTAFYIYNRLVSLNEVGGEPDALRHRRRTTLHALARERAGALAARDARDVDARHEAQRGRARAHQRAVGDARRVAGGARTLGAAERAAPHDVNGHAAPDANEEYLLYQTLLGAWPFGCVRPTIRAKNSRSASAST